MIEIDKQKTDKNAILKFEHLKHCEYFAYIASPFSGDTVQNMIHARRYCRYVYTNTNFIPIAPHLLFPQFMEDEVQKERTTAIGWNKKLLENSEFLLVFTPEDSTESTGMLEEIKYYEHLNPMKKNVIYFTCKNHKQNKQKQ